MKQFARTIGLLFALFGSTAWSVEIEQVSVESVPLYDDLGDHHVPITTDLASAQNYFDQGMRLYYAFNHAEAVRAFKEAQRLDVDCAMCWWGEAMAWGPNINLPMDEPSGIAAYAAVQNALARREHASMHEQALIDALGCALRGQAAGGSRFPRPGILRRNGRRCCSLSRKPGSRGTVRRIPDGPQTLGLLGRGW